MENCENGCDANISSSREQFEQEDISRYSRQLILPEIGIVGQAALQASSVLVVGAGGLGCPAIQYLAAAGCGKIGVVDYDEVETSNLHRQVLHTESGAKSHAQKASSAGAAVNKLNSKVSVVEHVVEINRDNAAHIVEQYDVVLDATDNLVTRYLLNDVCVLLNKPLISGSALRWEGQLTIYNFKSLDETSPCYRCLYPKPAPAETVTNCSDGGVIGVVPGIIGCIQALEAIKIILKIPPAYCKKLLIFDGLSGSFRSIKLRAAQPDCTVCGTVPTISLKSLPDYEMFCGSSANDKCISVRILPKERRISALTYQTTYFNKPKTHVLLDVRESVELQICSLPNAVNISLKVLDYCKTKIQNNKEKLSSFGTSLHPLEKALQNTRDKNNLKVVPIVVVCRLGNDSQKAVDFLDKCIEFESPVQVCDMAGGLMDWANTVDKSFFQY
uniref:Adenylyltransferase and sulfurtransferase MOCS3 homolog n=1 Tax=Phallusia mammillata TaxID=59560 RepID=A0A6F9DLN4_9ASCI|nr:adenylyltransferase and sulfurtransferase MOCS3-like [Phallusia mammillata]